MIDELPHIAILFCRSNVGRVTRVAIHDRHWARLPRLAMATVGAALSAALVLSSCGTDEADGDGDGDGDEAASATSAVDTTTCDDFVGIWEADEEAGGEDEVGGIYRAQLQLPSSGEASWSESDFIEVWESWSCVGDEIIGFSNSSVRWVDGEQITREPNPCQDLTTSAPRVAVPEDDTIVSTNTWVRCRSGRFEEGAPIATIEDDGTLQRNGFTLLP